MIIEDEIAYLVFCYCYIQSGLLFHKHCIRVFVFFCSCFNHKDKNEACNTQYFTEIFVRSTYVTSFLQINDIKNAPDNKRVNRQR